MTHKPITLKFIVPTVLALALGISIATPDAPRVPQPGRAAAARKGAGIWAGSYIEPWPIGLAFDPADARRHLATATGSLWG
jgi:hypothetical protein